MPADQIGRYIRLNGMQPHDVLDWIMQGEPNEIDSHDTRKTLRKLPKELIEISMNRNGLRHFQQGLIAL